MRASFEHRQAAHCESGVTAALFRQAGLDLDEPMVFGIGSGLFFFQAPFVKVMGMPLVAYRTYPGSIFKLCCRRLGVSAVRRSFSSEARGVRALDELLERGVPVGLQANMFWLEYFPREFRSQFNGHNLVALRRDGDEYELSDPVLEEPVRCPVDALTRARFAKGPLAPRGALYHTTAVEPPADPSAAILAAVRDTARRMLAPVPLLGVRGIRALGRQVRRWPAKHPGSRRPFQLLGHVVRMQEEVGSGGAGFRFMYAAFLQQAGDLLDHAALREASERMTRAGDLWHAFAVTCGRLIKDRVRAGESFGLAADQLDACAAAEEDVYRFLLASTRARRGSAQAAVATK